MTTILVDIPETTLAAALEDADVTVEADLDAGETATGAVVTDALELWAALENPREVLQNRDDLVCRSAPDSESEGAEVSSDD